MCHFAVITCTVITGRMPQRPKIRFFAPQERLVAPIQVKLGTADGHVGPLSCAKFNLNRRRGNAAAKYQQFPLFGKQSPRRGEPLSRFLKILWAFIRQYAASEFQIWRDSLHRLRSYCWETACRSITPILSAHPAGKTILWIEKWISPFSWTRRTLWPCKVWERIYNARRLYLRKHGVCMFFTGRCRQAQ